MSRDEIYRYIGEVWNIVKFKRPELYYTIRVLDCPDATWRGRVWFPISIDDVSSDSLVVHMDINQPLATPYTIRHEFGHIIDCYNKWMRIRSCLPLFRQWVISATSRPPSPQFERMADLHARELPFIYFRGRRARK